MILATIQTGHGTAVLTEEGWHVPDNPTLGRLLDLDAPISRFGPSEGDPAACAAVRAVEFLGPAAEVLYIRPPAPQPPDTVF